MYDYVLDLRQDQDSLWKNVSYGQRGHIRSARECMQVVPATRLRNGREAYADLMETLFEREKFRLLTREQFYGVFEKVYGGTYGQAFFGLADGKPVCVAGISKNGKIASYLHAARSDDAMNGASSLSLWSGIEWAKSAGCEWFELGGIIPEKEPRKIAGHSRIQESFGGQIIQVHGGKREFRPLGRATCEFHRPVGSRGQAAGSAKRIPSVNSFADLMSVSSPFRLGRPIPGENSCAPSMPSLPNRRSKASRLDRR